jgi:hypothetical protein
MLSSHVNPDEFARVGTRRIQRFSAASSAPVVIGAGSDGHVYVWNVETKSLVCDFPTSEKSGGVSVALTPQARECLVGTYYAWGVACVDVVNKETRWRRTDLRKVYGLSASADAKEVVAWFDGRAGLRLDLQTGQVLSKSPGLRMFAASRFDSNELNYKRQFELSRNGRVRHKWPRDSFALLSCAFSPQLCVVAESAVPAKAIELTSGKVEWVYRSRDGAHLIEVDFCPSLDCFAALEYAYTEAGRETGPMVALLHFDLSGRVVFRKAINDCHDAVFCADGTLVLNGLGELYETSTGTLAHVFEFPR